MAAERMTPVAGERAAPSASALLESLRGFGYSLASAIADIVDNSISAGASNISVHCQWAGPNSWIRVLDDGNGMSLDELVAAMTPGTVGPLGVRAETDLGRFGLGLKTASFSQCRKVSVATRTDGSKDLAIRAWDLDLVAETEDWLLRTDVADDTAGIIAPLSTMPRGTAVVWQCMDRVVGDEPESNNAAEERFYIAVDEVKEQLAMVFHRLLSGDPGVRLFLNGEDERHRVRPWDPFLSNHSATQRTPLEQITFRGQKVTLQGFVLPHRDRLSEREYELAGGPAGWSAQQGFYVHRNHRLLVSGGWLGLGDSRAWTREEQYKLARISVEFPNALDPDWRLDVKKSVAYPPQEIRSRMAELASAVRDLSRRVYAWRGVLAGDTESPIGVRPWIVTEDAQGPRYRISRVHPLVTQALSQTEDAGTLEALLQLVELTVPIQRIWLDAAEAMAQSERQPTTLPALQDVIPVARQLLAAMRDGQGMDADQARKTILSSEPFRFFPELSAYLEG